VIVLLVALGAAVGAPLRYLVDRALQARHDSLFPWGTFVVNTAGSLLLGLLAAAAWAVEAPVMELLGTGLCGALTTYSTLGYETVRMLQGKANLLAGLNIAASIVAGLGAAYLGAAIAQAVSA
jgi:fluoride exporter